MLEVDIKAHLLTHLHRKHLITEDTLIASELTVGGFSRRADLAILSSKDFIAYEIKSASDNLNRLSGQIHDYLKYFDKVIVVVDSKHLKATLQSTPENVGVWELVKKQFIVRRRGVKQKIKDKSALSSFLTSNEIAKLTPVSLEKDDRKSQKKYMLKANTAKDIREVAFKLLHRKFSQTSFHFLQKLNNKVEITNLDIESLSLYIPERRALEKKKALKSKLWEIWEAEQSLIA